MASLPRTLPFVAVALAFATPFLIVACGDTAPLTTSSGTATSSGSSSATSGDTTSATGTGGAGGGKSSTTSTSSTAASTGGAASTGTTTGAGGAATGGIDAGDGGGAGGFDGGAGGFDPGDGGDGGVFDPGDGGDAAARPDGSGTCGTTMTAYPVDPSPHVTTCFPVVYSSNPPTSGPHYPIWAAFRTYGTPIPRGFTVHDLEHGAIVISYKCAGGCAPELAALQAFVDARPVDPSCTAPVKSRIVIVPDPLLDVPFAAAAWGFALTSQCFDLAALGSFIDAHYAMGPENFCFDGQDVTAADAGIPGDCGDLVDAGAGPG